LPLPSESCSNPPETSKNQLKTPRRIALIDATMDQDVADFRRKGEAVTAFYARLTPDQQVIFDRETLSQGSIEPAE